MRSTESTDGAVRADGVVVKVDPVNRELAVRFADGPRVIDVPPGCPITLRGERVRLRLVQARDHVRVTYVESRTPRVALAIEVQPGPASWKAMPGSAGKATISSVYASSPPADAPTPTSGKGTPSGS